MRGMLNKEVQEIAKKEMGREISQTELRLIPYIQYQMINEQKLDPNKMNQEDRDVLNKWKSEKLVTLTLGVMMKVVMYIISFLM